MIGYMGQLIISMGRHLEEAALVLLVAVTVGAFYVRAGMSPPVLQLVLAIVVFQFGVASWRLYRTQQVSIATTRSLRNLDEFDRVNSEQRLRAHYEHRERRLEQWHNAHVKRLIDNVSDVSRELTHMQETRR
ncbi:MAG TPA: hypothetical protein VKU62_10035 [Thermoanaerobaculia bacterium]|nr:hypothetical protein [Thermoanaerobaculia bacterium]